MHTINNKTYAGQQTHECWIKLIEKFNGSPLERLRIREMLLCTLPYGNAFTKQEKIKACRLVYEEVIYLRKKYNLEPIEMEYYRKWKRGGIKEIPPLLNYLTLLHGSEE